MSDKIPDNSNHNSDDKNFSFMKLINEIKKESGININFSSGSHTEKVSKLKFEPNLNLKRNFVPNAEIDKSNLHIEDKNIVNLNQITSRFNNNDSLNIKKQTAKKDKKSNLIMLADMLKYENADKKPKKVRNEDEDIRGIVNNLRQKDNNGYYPTTLPFKLNESDDTNIIKDLINDNGTLNENNIFLFQFPRVIPFNLEIQEKTKNEEIVNDEPIFDSNGFLVKSEFKNVFKSIKSNIQIGKMKIFKSGKIKLEIGNSHFDINGGITTKFAQEVVLYSENTDEMVSLGKISDRKIIVVPDF